MEYRCEWCGKPHPADDPPCDNCGHGSFERAVVPQRQAAEPSDPVWVCADCGRTHERHSPPCSRCGSTTLERGERDYGDLPDGEGPSYLSLASRRYLAVAAVGVVGLAVLALGVTGVLSVPGLGDGGTPTVSDVPGHGDTYRNVSLAAAERGFVAQLNEDREARGARELSRDEELAALARYANRKSLKAGDGERPSLRELETEFSPGCTVEVHRTAGEGTSLGPLWSNGTDGESLGEAVATVYLSGGWQVGDENSRVGVDLHVTPAGKVVALVATC